MKIFPEWTTPPALDKMFGDTNADTRYLFAVATRKLGFGLEAGLKLTNPKGKMTLELDQ